MLNTQTTKMEYQIKFGTDGWREIIGDNFTVANVEKISQAVSKWLLKSNKKEWSIVIGFDCRFGGKMFANKAAEVFISYGIDVFLSDDFVSTPMVSLYTKHINADLGIVITASHNPPSYSGYKIKGSFGGPAFPKHIAEIEQLIENDALFNKNTKGKISIAPIEELYIETLKKTFNIPAIQKLNFAYDAMFGAGQNVIRKIFSNAHLLHCSFNPSFEGRAPEPIAKNLPELSDLIKNNKEITSGLATDGDADRIGFFDENGNFVDSHHLILIIINYLVKYKNLTGTVVKSFSVSNKIGKMCAYFNLPEITTKIGFKYICEHMVNDDVLIGAEESGGIAIKGHIPERDGIWMAMVIWEYMANTGLTVSQLIAKCYEITGAFAVERYDLHVSDELKNNVIKKCSTQKIDAIGKYEIILFENLDGFKFHTKSGEWVMIRASGTEPVLRIYAEAENSAKSFEFLEETCRYFGLK